MSSHDDERDVLSIVDWETIIESLESTRLRIQNYDKYPSEQYKQQRIGEIKALISRIKELLKA